MQLYFKDSNNTKHFVVKTDSVKECLDSMYRYMYNHHMKRKYIRICESKEHILIDVGSYTESFLVFGISIEEFIEEMKGIEN